MNRPGATALMKRDTSSDKTDYDVLRENHRFLWPSDDEEADVETQSERNDWGRRLAKKYYDSLFREFTICDLSRYKEDRVAMRWRTEAEVVEGKGQLICGEKSCSSGTDLRTWEVNFKYEEEGTSKNALVKLRLCPRCSDLLNYRNRCKEVLNRTSKKKRRKKEKRKRKSKGKREMTPESVSSCTSDSEMDTPGVKRHKKCAKGDPKPDDDEVERFLDKFWNEMLV